MNCYSINGLTTIQGTLAVWSRDSILVELSRAHTKGIEMEDQVHQDLIQEEVQDDWRP
jgi:hypothetical protein